jgi:hypothetical protein
LPVFELEVRRDRLDRINGILVTKRQVPAELALFLNSENIIQVLALSHRTMQIGRMQRFLAKALIVIADKRIQKLITCFD